MIAAITFVIFAMLCPVVRNVEDRVDDQVEAAVKTLEGSVVCNKQLPGQPVISVILLNGRCWALPTLVGNVLYVRDEAEITAVRLADQARRAIR